MFIENSYLDFPKNEKRENTLTTKNVNDYVAHDAIKQRLLTMEAETRKIVEMQNKFKNNFKNENSDEDNDEQGDCGSNENDNDNDNDNHNHDPNPNPNPISNLNSNHNHHRNHHYDDYYGYDYDCDYEENVNKNINDFENNNEEQGTEKENGEKYLNSNTSTHVSNNQIISQEPKNNIINDNHENPISKDAIINDNEKPSENDHVEYPSLDDQKALDERSIFVNNLDNDITAAELRDLFAQCGTIERITIVCDKWTGKPKGCSYVQFKDQQSVVGALALNQTTLKGKTITIEQKRTNLPKWLRDGGRGRAHGPLNVEGIRGRGHIRGSRRGRGRGRAFYDPSYYGIPYHIPAPPPPGYGFIRGYRNPSYWQPY